MSEKTYTVYKTRGNNYNQNTARTAYEGTLEQLISTFSNTLANGASYEGEKGCSKINQNPKSIKSLISNLNKAVNNCAANGCSNITYSTKKS